MWMCTMDVFPHWCRHTVNWGKVEQLVSFFLPTLMDYVNMQQAQNDMTDESWSVGETREGKQSCLDTVWNERAECENTLR